jgi:hypothetical protein
MMNKKNKRDDRLKAEALDTFINRMQEDQNAKPKDKVEQLVEELHKIKAESGPDPIFRAALTQKVQQHIKQQKYLKAHDSQQKKSLVGDFMLSIRKMGIAVVVTALIMALAIVIYQQLPLNIAFVPTASSTSTVFQSTPGESVLQPTPAIPTSTPGKPTTIPPTATQVNIPTAAPELPVLAKWLNAGVGGGNAPNLAYTLQAELPEAPGNVTAYLQRLPDYNRDALQVKEIAAGLGMDSPELFSLPLVNVIIAVQGSQEIVSSAALDFYYVDRSVLNLPDGRYYYSDSLVPPAETVRQVAEAFLEKTWFMDLANSPFTIEIESERAYFYRIMEPGYKVKPAFATVTVSPEGSVALFEMHLGYLDVVGSYQVISAEEAWELVGDPDATERIFVRIVPGVDLNPPVWKRTYLPNQTVQISAPLIIYEGQPPYIRINGLRVNASEEQLNSLADAYRSLQQTSMDTLAPIQILGTISEDGSSIMMEDFNDVSGTTLWSGILSRDGNLGLLSTNDGLLIEVPDLPDDLQDNLNVFVEGGMYNDRLEWTVIQQSPAEGLGGNPPTEVVIENVEFGYLAPDGLALAQNSVDKPEYRALQPVWIFEGISNAGDKVTLYIQAVR